MKDEELKFENPTIQQTNENCQVFNGPISGCVFAMPGATVNQSSVQKVDGANAQLTTADKNVKSALEELQDAKDEQGAYIMHDLDQWYAVFRVLSRFCGYPEKPKEFEKTMKNLGADEFRLPCKYESFRKVALNKLPQNVALWKQYANSADQYSMKQIKVAVKLMELLHLE